MSKRDWLRWIPYLTATAALVIFIADSAINTFERYLALDQEWRNQNQYEQTQTQKSAEIISRNCSITEIPPSRVAQCLVEEISRYVEKTHSDQDLQAQNKMAYWAQALFWLSGVGAIFSFVGLWLLFRSLRHTRTAIADTREIGEAQVRAYLSIDTSQEIMSIQALGRDQIPKVRFQIKNSGNSPALKFTYAAAVLLEPEGFPRNNSDILAPYAVGPEPSDVLPAGDYAHGETSNTEAWTNEMVQSAVGPNPTKKIVLAGIANYTDVFHKPQKTRFCLQLKILENAGPKGGETRGRFRYTWHKTAQHNDAT